MVKSWALLGLVLVGVCVSEAFKHQKRQSSSQKCCFPSKYAWKIVRKSKYSSSSGRNTDPGRILSNVFTTTSISESIEIVDNLKRYSDYGGGNSGYLTYVENGYSYSVYYSSYGECFNVYSDPYYSYGSSQHCLDSFTFDKQVEKNGVNYSVFVSQYSSESNNQTSTLYALLNAEGECSPRIRTDERFEYFSGGLYTKNTETTVYSDLEMGPEQQNWLEPPPESRRCKSNRK